MAKAAFAVSVLAAACVFAAEGIESRGPRTVPGAYIIEFDENADAVQFQSQAEPDFETRLNLNYGLFQGVSIQLADVDSAEERASQLASLPSVKNIWPVTAVDAPKPIVDDGFLGSSPSQDTLRKRHDRHQTRQDNGTAVRAEASIVSTQIDRLHAEGITGVGYTIAIIDSGVDYHHPALGGCFGPGCLVSRGYDFVGDNYEMGEPENPAVPDDDPDDCLGHGTHVAGIIAAQENPYFVGAAPGVNIAAYRVLGCTTGSVSDDILIAAFNKAYEDGADIITASLGTAGSWPSAPWSVAVSRIVEKGVPCTVSAGNYGQGLFDSNAPSAGKGVTAIASFDNTEFPAFVHRATYRVGEDDTAEGFQYIPWKPSVWGGAEREIWVTGYDLSNRQDACLPLPDDKPDLSEYNVLIRRAARCSPFTQAANVAAKGARFLTMYNDQPGLSSLDLTGFSETENILAAAMVTQDQGESWVKALESGSVVRTTIDTLDDDAEPELILLDNYATGGGISAYTSWGPVFDMSFKPQFGAPGGYILSTVPLEDGGYRGMSGTSMAAPMAAAAYALIAQARGTKPEPALFESLLSSTAKAQLFQWKGPFQDLLAPAAQAGAGMIQVYDAAYATTYLEPISLSYNDTANFAGTLNFTIINDGSEEVTYNITHVPTRSLYTLKEDGLTSYDGPVDGIGPYLDEHAELEFSDTKVTISPGSSATVAVTASPPQGLDEARYPYWSGYIAINGTDDSSAALPYQGLSGSLQEADIIDEDGGLYLIDWNTNDLITANQTVTFPAPGVPTDDSEASPLVITGYIQWGSSHVMANVVPLDTSSSNATATAVNDTDSIGQVLGYPAYFQPRSFLYKSWVGQLDGGQYAPAGRYKIVFKVLRIYGDASNEDDWMACETVPFMLEYAESTRGGSV